MLLESLAGPDQDLLASARLVATDIINALGSPEIAQVDRDGRIRTRYMKNDQQFVSFVEECGVETTEERVPRV